MHKYYYRYLNKAIRFVKPSVILRNSVGDMKDVQETLSRLNKKSRPEDRLMITYYNHLWEPILKLASWLGWRRKIDEQNWLDTSDIINLLNLSGWEVISHKKRLLVPVDIPFVSNIVNSLIAPMPIINSLCLMTWVVAKPRSEKQKEYSVSIIVAARNEEENIPKIVKSIPRFGKWQEVVFIEGHSKDATWEKIQEQVKKISKRLGRWKSDALKGYIRLP